MRDSRKVMRMLLLRKLAAAWLCLVFIQLFGLAIANEAGIASSSDGEPLEANGQATSVNNHQAPPAYDPEPQLNNDTPPANDQLPVGNNQAQSASDQPNQINNQPPANEQPLQANGQATSVNNHQAPPAYDPEPQLDNFAPPANDQLPVGNNQAPPASDEPNQVNNETPRVNEHPMQPDNHASLENQKYPQADNQVPQVDEASVANSYATLNKQSLQNNAPIQQASNDRRAAPVHRDQIVPTHGALPPPNGQRRPPPPEGKIPPPVQAPPPPPVRAPPPPPVRAPPPPPVRAPPPPPGRAPPPPPKHRVPAFLIPSSELSDTFDSPETSFVYVLPSRSRQCFHQRSAKSFVFEYTILHGGKLDINAYVVGPDGRIVYESRELRQGRYLVPAPVSQKGAELTAAIKNRTSDGSADLPLYTICLDNRYASWYAKLVDFSIQLVPRRQRGSDEESEVINGPLLEELSLELDRLNVSWTHFVELTDALEDNLYQSVGYQRQFRSEETRDRMAMEDSAYCVTMWSLLQLVVMTAVSALQVLMIRALFDEKSAFHRVWRSK